MALTPIDEQHALQIQAGTIGRKAGHAFEDEITKRINELPKPYRPCDIPGAESHVFSGKPEIHLLNYICSRRGVNELTDIVALSTGALATSEEGKNWLEINGVVVRRCKSDIILTFTDSDENEFSVGVSSKQCNKPKPTNAQLFCSTAFAFCQMLRNARIPVSINAERSLRQLCGDRGFRPLDDRKRMKGRVIDPTHYFWEETDAKGRAEFERLFAKKQNEITRLLLQKAYLDDPFTPDFLLHKTKRADSLEQTQIALYSIDELVELSRNYAGFHLREYSVNKGSHRDPPGVKHLAPRFGIVQMQRLGNKQNATQLQFNLKAGYFYKI